MTMLLRLLVEIKKPQCFLVDIIEAIGEVRTVVVGGKNVCLA